MSEWPDWVRIDRSGLARYVNRDAALDALGGWPSEVSDASGAPTTLQVLAQHDRRRLAEVIYEQVVRRAAAYQLEDLHFREDEQRIRTPAQILQLERQGTCLDLACLYSALCLKANLLPFIVVSEEHAFVVLSLSHSAQDWNGLRPEVEPGSLGILEPSDLLVLMGDGTHLAVESTGLVRSPRNQTGTPQALSFDEATAAGRASVEGGVVSYAVDVAYLQGRGVEPYEPSGAEHTDVGSLLRFWPLLQTMDVDPTFLGVFRSEISRLASGSALGPYVSREIDQDLEAAISEQPFVLLKGDSKAGKSRTAFESLYRALPEAHLVVPRDPGALRKLLSPRALAEVLGKGANVLWLDDLQRYLEIPKAIDARDVEDLSRREERVVIVATIRRTEYQRISQTPGEIGRAARDLLALAAPGLTLPRDLEGAERREAERLYPDETFAAYEGIGEHFAATQGLKDKLENGLEDRPEGVAIVRAAVDWRRAGLERRPIGRDDLRELSRTYFRELEPIRPFSEEQFDEGLSWACEPVERTAALLIKDDDQAAFHAFDFVVDYTERAGGADSRPVHQATWQFAIERAGATHELSSVAFAAYSRGEMAVSEEAARLGDEGGDADASSRLGVLLHERGELEAAEAAYRRGEERGSVKAMYNLGLLLRQRGDTEEAEAAYRRAEERGEADASVSLGVMLYDRGDLVGAEAAYRRGDGLGGATAAFALGWSLEQRGDLEEAEAAYRRADERGFAEAPARLGLLLGQRGDAVGAEAAFRRGDERGGAIAAYRLGLLLEEQGDMDGAEGAYRRADERGVADAAANLGILLERRGDSEGAEAAYRRGDERESSIAAYILGLSLEEKGDMEGAEAAYRRADERGDADAPASLGVLLGQRGDAEGAEAAFRRGDERGGAIAAYRLGLLLEEQGDMDGAEGAYRRADERGDADAAANLGILLERRGDSEGAEAAYRRGDERESSIAAYILGLSLEEKGDMEGAEAAYRRADERGDADAPASLGVLLGQRGDAEGAEAAFRRGDERGDAFAAHNLGVLLEEQGDMDGAEGAYRRADERGVADAAANLGILLERRGDSEGAEAAYRRADERGHGSAADNLGA